jgi:hypothetical protein
MMFKIFCLLSYDFTQLFSTVIFPSFHNRGKKNEIPKISQLNRVDICVAFANGIDLKFILIKFHLFQIGLSPSTVKANLSLGYNAVQSVNELKYLGVV